MPIEKFTQAIGQPLCCLDKGGDDEDDVGLDWVFRPCPSEKHVVQGWRNLHMSYSAVKTIEARDWRNRGGRSASVCIRAPRHSDGKQLQQQHQQKQQAREPRSSEPAGEAGGEVDEAAVGTRLLLLFRRPSTSATDDGPCDEERLLICKRETHNACSRGY
ncbi:hypothetical protein CAPTEDRAFT_207388 [Capitella teleta]|uniref:Uncharacterized protein n=1 Tax=Capitella teleta TaxID=283909 RepID=R7UMV3_CAPTE|nr:hypothetical protein CAPTEDRAFT_207388 [Capitella teleta]|eukprot:ELU04587.1 hypothetical protein CAPTEDRAFT_207388 [Capitella teleta]